MRREQGVAIQADEDLVFCRQAANSQAHGFALIAGEVNEPNLRVLLCQRIEQLPGVVRAGIVDGDVRFDQNMETFSECIVFATGDIYVRQASSAEGVGATLIAMGNIEIEQNAVFQGIIFSEGEVDIGSNAEITGTIVGGNGIRLDSNVNVTFDPDVFLNPLPGLKNRDLQRCCGYHPKSSDRCGG